jgi:hypothetical protein
VQEGGARDQQGRAAQTWIAQRHGQ